MPPSRPANILPILPILQDFTGLLGATWSKSGCGLRPARFLRSYDLAFMNLVKPKGYIMSKPMDIHFLVAIPALTSAIMCSELETRLIFFDHSSWSL